jgi:uncharacterized protein (TIGR02145 family)
MTNKGRILSYPLALLCVLLIFTISCKKSVIPPQETVTDADGNVYHSVTIGTQVWLVENLKTTKYNNGDPITNVSDATAWKNLTSGAYCNHNNDPGFSTTYGRLYNLYAVSDSRTLAPTGWHVATDADWTTLVTYLGGITLAGGKLKEQGIVHWPNPNIGASNSSGFTALPGGYRDDFGLFNTIAGGFWWSSTQYGIGGAWSVNMSFATTSVVRTDAGRGYGYAVRCIKN